VLTGNDPDDTCNGDSYDDCGLCLNTDGNNTPDPFAKADMWNNCRSDSWTSGNCESCGSGECVTYNVAGHPGHNAMDCAGVCINGYYDAASPTSAEGLWGAAYIDTSYTDGDSDGWGKQGTGAPYCTSGDIPEGRVGNQYDLDDDNANICGSAETDCLGNCRLNVDESQMFALSSSRSY
jgi:hypothetical protein